MEAEDFDCLKMDVAIVYLQLWANAIVSFCSAFQVWCAISSLYGMIFVLSFSQLDDQVK